MYASSSFLSDRPAWRAAKRVSPRKFTPTQLDWLHCRESLTQRLQGLADTTGKPFSVRLLKQQWACPAVDERRLLGIGAGRHALLREVALCLDGEAVVLARTLIPAITLRGRCRQLQYLGSRPLGSFLFAGRPPGRNETQLAMLEGLSLKLPAMLADSKVAARRTLYQLEGRQLLVGEYFLPELMKLVEEGRNG